MRILVTGSSGFVGQYLRDHLKSAEQIPVSLQHTAIENISFERIHAIVHLAGIAHRMQGAPEDLYFKINCDQTCALAMAAKKNGVKQFIFLSTAKIFGEQSNQSFTLASIPNPNDDYSRSKYLAEQKLLALATEDFKIAIIRPPVIYGPNVKGNIQSLVELIKKNILLPFKGIDNRRSVLFVGNLTAFVEKILEKNSQGVFLVADDKPISTTQLVEWMQQEYSNKSRLIQIPSFLKMLIKIFLTKHYVRLFSNFEMDTKDSFAALDFKSPFTTREGITHSNFFVK
ncbi:MAG: NAD-dependent epimerase/dehydratase family protein [Pseudomonadota bacterium]